MALCRRHRFLPGAKLDQPERLAGIVAADEMLLLAAQKGAREHGCILVARRVFGPIVLRRLDRSLAALLA